MMRRTSTNATRSLFCEARLRAVEVLAKKQRGDATDVVSALQKIADQDEVPKTAEAYRTFAFLLDAFRHLDNWGVAVRAAEVDADRHRRAGQQLAKDLLARLAAGTVAAEISERIVALQAVEELPTIATLLLSVPLPLPSPRRPESTVRVPPVTTNKAGDEGPVVAGLLFSFDGRPLSEPLLVRPGVLYDVGLRLTMSRWPSDLRRLRLTPMHIEPPGVMTLPSFVIEPGQETAGVFSPATGRLAVTMPQAIPARPLEVTYAAFAEWADKPGTFEPAPRKIRVEGQSRLLLQSFDPETNPVSGVREVDQRILALRGPLAARGLPDREVSWLLLLLASLGRRAFQALADGCYKGQWSESRFQADIRTHLRNDPLIGSELEEHAHAAGGIVDLSFQKIRIELKADDDGDVTLESAAERYGQQAAQYAAGSDRRSCVLAVLDTKQKTSAPGPVGGDIGLATYSPKGSSDRGTTIGVVVLRGNLATPSSLSK